MYLVDANGVQVAAYDYDPYGKVISSTGDLAEINPLRYRGYYYDSETGFYYLQSRYYDPEICRFINADNYASTGQSFGGYNMFAYCSNNPISRKDIAGDTWITALIGGIIGAVVGGVSAAIVGGDATSIIAGAVGGAVGGAIVGATGNYKAGKIIGRAAGSAVIATATFIDAKAHGASTESALLAASANFGIAFGVASLSSLCGSDALASGMVDTVFGFGGTLAGAGITELITSPSRKRSAICGRTSCRSSNYIYNRRKHSAGSNVQKNRMALLF